ncbi:Hypothetical predicted protein [Octopus vulgaris]|uniref:Uncharacterized protein n=1 Tax=Octopus vulgaris TaxID=6645 RepID=A0AA36AX93_OCTVU|nr:Hypothetical predicted protein [Octopus vulgaris]
MNVQEFMTKRNQRPLTIAKRILEDAEMTSNCQKCSKAIFYNKRFEKMFTYGILFDIVTAFEVALVVSTYHSLQLFV